MANIEGWQQTQIHKYYLYAVGTKVSAHYREGGVPLYNNLNYYSVFVECYWPELGLDVAFLIHSAGLSSVPPDIV